MTRIRKGAEGRRRNPFVPRAEAAASVSRTEGKREAGYGECEVQTSCSTSDAYLWTPEGCIGVEERDI